MSGFAKIQGKQPAIFCDFDGTITERDVIVMIMEAFAPPEWEGIINGIIHERTITIKDGIRQLFDLIPSTRAPEIVTYVKKHVRLRTGFSSFLDFCNENNIPFYVVSGGVDFFIDPVLKPFGEDLARFCNMGRLDTKMISLDMPYLDETCETCQSCAVCKVGVMNSLSEPDSHFRIAIGDSLTDLAIAGKADAVFARSHLIQQARDEGIEVTPFETFNDIRDVLSGWIQAQGASAEAVLNNV